MKSSSTHRSNLSKEKMSMIENVKPEIYQDWVLNSEYKKFQKKPELDVLWKEFEKSVQTKSVSKNPFMYLSTGFVLGFLSALIIAVIIGVLTYSDIQNKPDFEKTASPKIEIKKETPALEPVQNNKNDEAEDSSEEEYTVKAGDTLDKIAYRFYGQYDQNKIDEIMKLNNIKDPTRIQIGQILRIPLY